MEYKYYENIGSKVLIGHRCNIGKRLKYSAIFCETGKFANLRPNDICVFLGHAINVETDLSHPEGLHHYNEIAVVKRLGTKVKLAVGVLEPFLESRTK